MYAHHNGVNDLNYKKTITIITVITLTLLTLSGCTTFDNFKKAFIDKPQDNDVTIAIGVYEPMSGSDKAGAAAEVEGIELAHEMYPTVQGKIVELIYADNSSDIEAAETAINTLISREPTVILGSYSDVLSLSACEAIEKAKIPTIAITNTNPLITKDYDYYCRVCYVDSNQGDLLAQYVLNNRKQKQAGVLAPAGDDAAQAEATAFTDRMRAETGDDDAITFYEYFHAGDQDFTKQLTKAKKKGVKQIIITGEIADAANIINQAADMDLDIQFLGDSKWGTEDFTSLLNENVTSDMMAFVQFFATDGDPATATVSKEKETFLKAYKEKHGNQRAEHEDAVALGYDAYCLALDVISKTPEDATSEDIIKLLTGPQYQFEGASGLINFSSIGDPVKTAYISTWENGSINTLYTIDPVE